MTDRTSTGESLSLERFVAMAAIFLLPIHVLSPVGSSSLDLGGVIALLFLLISGPNLLRTRVGTRLAVLVVAALASGVVLDGLAAGKNGRSLVSSDRLHIMLGLLSASLLMVTVLWVKERQTTSAIAITYGLGVIVNALLDPSLSKTDGWKYAYSWPVTVVILALAARRKNDRPWTLISIFGLTAFTLTRDYRSLLGFFVLVLVVYLFRFGARDVLSRRRVAQAMVLVVIVGIGVYNAAEHLAVGGYLGQRNQVVTQDQLSSGYPLLLNARPEWAAATELFEERPIGFGPGVQPNDQDVDAGLQGLQEVGAPYEDPAVTNYIFGTGIELHSIIADLWVNFGLIGLALALYFLYELILSFARLLASRRPPAFALFVLTVAIWDMFFSPVASNLDQDLFALALVVAIPSSIATRAGGRGPMQPLMREMQRTSAR